MTIDFHRKSLHWIDKIVLTPFQLSHFVLLIFTHADFSNSHINKETRASLSILLSWFTSTEIVYSIFHIIQDSDEWQTISQDRDGYRASNNWKMIHRRRERAG